MDQATNHHDTTKAVTTPLPAEGRRELALILVLFAALRAMSAFWFQPLYSEAGEFFFPFAWLQSSGYYPFLDYWLEYPPLLAYLLVGLRAVSHAVCGAGPVAWERACFVRAVQLSSVAWETATLALLYGLVRRTRGTRAAARACWVYIALFATAFAGLSYVDSFPVFLMLAGLTLAFSGRVGWSAMALAGGFMAKLIPVALLPVTLKSNGRARWRLAALGLFALFVVYFAAPFLATGTEWVAKSFESSARRSPWETPWALLGQRYGFGYVGPVPADMNAGFFEKYRVQGGIQATLAAAPAELLGEGPAARIQYFRVASRFARDLSFIRVASRFARDLSFIDSRSRSPWFWPVYGSVLLLVGVFYLGTFARLPAELPPRRRVVFAAFSMVVFLFCSKGWSPQFVLYLIPLLLVGLPPGEGAVWCLLLSLTAFAETPVWTHHLFGRPGYVETARLVLQSAVLVRTVLFIIVAARLWRRLWRD